MNADVFTSMMPEAIIMKRMRCVSMATVPRTADVSKLKYLLAAQRSVFVRNLAVCSLRHGNVDDCPKFTLPPLTPSSVVQMKNVWKMQSRLRMKAVSRTGVTTRTTARAGKGRTPYSRLNEARARNQHVADILSIDERKPAVAWLTLACLLLTGM